MIRSALALPIALALAAAGCAPRGEASTYAIPAATLAPVRLMPCPERVPAAAAATHCPQEPR